MPNFTSHCVIYELIYNGSKLLNTIRMCEYKNLTLKETFALAVQNHKNNNLKVAKNLYNNVLKINPKFLNAYNNLGVLFKELRDHQKAINNLEKAIEIDANYLDAHNNLGVVFQEIGEYQKAISCFEKVITINPNLSTIQNILGIMFQNFGDHKKAIVCYERAIKIKPNFLNAHYNLGTVLLELGKYHKAIGCFEKSITIDPDNLNVLHSLLKCRYELDDKFIFLKELDDRIKGGMINAVIGSLASRSEIKFNTKISNPFCNEPLNFSLNTNLTKKYDFNNIFVKSVKKILKDNILSSQIQNLLINGNQSADNLFLQKNDSINKIKKIIDLEIQNYRVHFKNSKEGLIKNWPTNYDIRGWLVSMKSGGKIKPHIHEFGWLSGSIYINVPKKTKKYSGNLVVCLDDKEHQEEEISNPKKIMDVVTGSLCLFPSSLHHYTIPFESDEERIVLAFDMIPK